MDVSFSPTQIFAGNSVQGGYDRIAGIVSARTDTSLTVPSASLITNAGVTDYVSDAATITLGAGTAVTVPGQTTLASNTEQQISVGSWLDAFGTVTGNGGGNATPFATLSSDEMDVPISGPAAGSRHQITIGAEAIDVSGLTSDLLIEPSTGSSQVFAIAHA